MVANQKIALCFSGQLRSFEKSFSFYNRNLFEQYDVDVFIHSWSGPQNQLFLDIFKPKRYIFEQPLSNIYDEKYSSRTPNINRHPPFATVSMFYSMFKSFELVDEGAYDWVIRSRTDYALNRVIPFEKLDRNRLYIPSDRILKSRDGGNDQFAFGSFSTMQKYMSTYEHIDEYFNQGASLIGESLMRANLHHYKLTGKKLVYFYMNNPFYPDQYGVKKNSLIRDDYSQWLGYEVSAKRYGLIHQLLLRLKIDVKEVVNRIRAWWLSR